MDALCKKYFKQAYDLLAKWMPRSYEEFLFRYQSFPDECSLEEIDGYYYLIFVFPIIFSQDLVFLEQGITLVFDQDQIIADNSFFHGLMDDVMNNKNVYDTITTDSDWLYLQYYTLCQMMFPDVPYPFCESNQERTFLGETCFFKNAYVTKRYRQQHIFTNMLEITKEMALRTCTESSIYYSAFSLDPDIACYGEDTPKEPYIYSMKDEPARMLNKQILEKKGYLVLKLEEDIPDENSDGTKLWFAINKENTYIYDVPAI